MRVLDVGCGSGAITRGIAEAVAPGGTVVGVDRDRGLLERARANASALPGLTFEEADATRLTFVAGFDVVTAARTLQWIADLDAAIGGMARAANPGGLLVILDYNHALHSWEPSPPPEFADFYARFLAWRGANGWDNEIANHLPALLDRLGLEDIRDHEQNVTAVKGDPLFDETAGIWTEVIDNLGETMLGADACDAALLASARQSYEAWRKDTLRRHVLSMRTVVAAVPERRSLER
jgi:SAM-dependent methyltransferase